MSQTHALFQLGMDLEAQHRDQRPGTAQTEEQNQLGSVPAQPDVAGSHGQFDGSSDGRLDHFITRNGQRCAGSHLIIDLYEACGLDDLDLMDATLRQCVDASNATLLHLHLHHFTPNDGISGVAVLAESHISVHTWPEAGYAAFDVFMCGDANPHACVDVLREAFSAKRAVIDEHLRGKGV